MTVSKSPRHDKASTAKAKQPSKGQFLMSCVLLSLAKIGELDQPDHTAGKGRKRPDPRHGKASTAWTNQPSQRRFLMLSCVRNSPPLVIGKIGELDSEPQTREGIQCGSQSGSVICSYWQVTRAKLGECHTESGARPEMMFSLAILNHALALSGLHGMFTGTQHKSQNISWTVHQRKLNNQAVWRLVWHHVWGPRRDLQIRRGQSHTIVIKLLT